MPPQPLERLVPVDETTLAKLGRAEHVAGEVAEPPRKKRAPA